MNVEEGDTMVEGVENFKHTGRNLEQMDYDWPAVMQKIICARLVRGILGTLLRREGVETKVSEMFYREVVQAVLLFGADTWVLLVAMEWKVEGRHTCFLQHTTVKERGG